MKKHITINAVEQFDKMPDAMLVNIATASTIIGRSRASIYRHFLTGDLTPIKVGSSTRIRISDLRRLIGAK